MHWHVVLLEGVLLLTSFSMLFLLNWYHTGDLIKGTVFMRKSGNWLPMSVILIKRTQELRNEFFIQE